MKKIIVGCDGTWLNSEEGYDQKSYLPWASKKRGTLVTPSNVTRICRALQPAQPTTSDTPTGHTGQTARGNTQVVCYQPGVASSDGFWDRYVNGATADSITTSIRDAYCSLVENYEDGDEIFLLGFSRGSFVARSTATLVYDIGILTKRGMEYWYDIFEDWAHQDRVKYKDWTNWSHGSYEMQEWYHGLTFRRGEKQDELPPYTKQLVKNNFTRPSVPIKAVGCWDTVGSLGIPRLVLTNPLLRPFAWLMNRFLQRFDRTIHLQFVDNYVLPNVHACFHALAIDEEREPFSPTLWDIPVGREDVILKQVWFPGTHGNISGSVRDESLPSLTLTWMISQLETLGLEFDADYLHWCRIKARDHKHAALHSARVAQELKQYGTANRQISRHNTGWALGSLYDALSGSGSYNKLGGIVARTPGRYCRLGSDPPCLLQRTGEWIHPSVRSRRAVSHLHPNHVATIESEGTWAVRTQSPSRMDGTTDRNSEDLSSPKDDDDDDDDVHFTSALHTEHNAPQPNTKDIILRRALKTASAYAPWNYLLHHDPKHPDQANKKAEARYYDPPALDRYRLYHESGKQLNWTANGREIMRNEWDPRMVGWGWRDMTQDEGAGDVGSTFSGSRRGKAKVKVNVKAADEARGSGEVVPEESIAGLKCLPEWPLTATEALLVDELGEGGDA